ncbi:MAG: hypothetical protein V2J55_06905, partial [Candidatus Competibacteraceae bacterium]|nr:hypothetical protein [Candidatus Competibacteraceae bacterium]
ISNLFRNEDRKAEKELHTPLRQTHLAVQQTKKTLQLLTRQASLNNDQRNAVVNGIDLPDMGTLDYIAGMNRPENDSYHQDMQDAQQRVQQNLQNFAQPNQQPSNQVVQIAPSIVDFDGKRDDQNGWDNVQKLHDDNSSISSDSRDNKKEDYRLDNHVEVLGTWQKLLGQLGQQLNTSKLDNGPQDLTQGLNMVMEGLQTFKNQGNELSSQQWNLLNQSMATLEDNLAKVTPQSTVANLQKELSALRETLNLDVDDFFQSDGTASVSNDSSNNEIDDYRLDNHANKLGAWQQLLGQLGNQINTSTLDNGLQDLTQGLKNVTDNLQVVMNQNNDPSPQQVIQLKNTIDALQDDLAKVTPQSSVANLQKELVGLSETLESFGNWASV